jgi:hypothetical protein
MQKNQPILSCAGREAVSIDAALLKELLLSFTPNTIGIRAKADQVSHALHSVAIGQYGDYSLEKFKEIITTEFLSVQLMEASNLARQASEDAKQASSIDTM